MARRKIEQLEDVNSHYKTEVICILWYQMLCVFRPTCSSRNDHLPPSVMWSGLELTVAGRPLLYCGGNVVAIHCSHTLQGAVTPIDAVVSAATGVTMRSQGHGGF